jgi:hypothetical protein
MTRERSLPQPLAFRGWAKSEATHVSHGDPWALWGRREKDKLLVILQLLRLNVLCMEGAEEGWSGERPIVIY